MPPKIEKNAKSISPKKQIQKKESTKKIKKNVSVEKGVESSNDKKETNKQTEIQRKKIVEEKQETEKIAETETITSVFPLNGHMLHTLGFKRYWTKERIEEELATTPYPESTRRYLDHYVQNEDLQLSIVARTRSNIELAVRNTEIVRRIFPSALPEPKLYVYKIYPSNTHVPHKFF